jgi:hypothetical protein
MRKNCGQNLVFIPKHEHMKTYGNPASCAGGSALHHYSIEQAGDVALFPWSDLPSQGTLSAYNC